MILGRRKISNAANQLRASPPIRSAPTPANRSKSRPKSIGSKPRRDPERWLAPHLEHGAGGVPADTMLPAKLADTAFVLVFGIRQRGDRFPERQEPGGGHPR
jgi:hypothetical protein